jgi:hypothetical protein
LEKGSREEGNPRPKSENLNQFRNLWFEGVNALPPELVQAQLARPRRGAQLNPNPEDAWGWRVNNREELEQAVNNRDVNIQIPVMIMDDIEVDPERI